MSIYYLKKKKRHKEFFITSDGLYFFTIDLKSFLLTYIILFDNLRRKFKTKDCLSFALQRS